MKRSLGILLENPRSLGRFPGKSWTLYCLSTHPDRHSIPVPLMTYLWVANNTSDIDWNHWISNMKVLRLRMLHALQGLVYWWGGVCVSSDSLAIFISMTKNSNCCLGENCWSCQSVSLFTRQSTFICWNRLMIIWFDNRLGLWLIPKKSLWNIHHSRSHVQKCSYSTNFIFCHFIKEEI